MVYPVMKQLDTDSLVENFSEILSDTSQKILKIMKQKNRNKNKNSCKRRQKWYDENCHRQNKKYR